MALCVCDNIELHGYEFPSDSRQIQSLSNYKNSDLSPWGHELICAFTLDEAKMHALWPKLRLTNQCNLVALVSDFYLYEYIIHTSGFNKIPADILQDFLASGLNPSPAYESGREAVRLQAEIVKTWTPVLKEYLHFAVVHELCHNRVFSQSFNSDSVRAAMWGWGMLGARVGRESLARYAHDLFSRPWKKFFGGSKWRSVSNLLVWAESGMIETQPFSDHLFFDRIFSLQHNTGTVFDKVDDWDTGKWFGSDSNVHELKWLKSILNAHHEGEIAKIVRHASPVAQALYAQHTHTERP